MYNDDEINIQVGRIITALSMEYRGTALYKLTRDKYFRKKNWEKIISNLEYEHNIKTSINVAEIPFIFE